jgi:hypothetical protein
LFSLLISLCNSENKCGNILVHFLNMFDWWNLYLEMFVLLFKILISCISFFHIIYLNPQHLTYSCPKKCSKNIKTIIFTFENPWILYKRCLIKITCQYNLRAIHELILSLLNIAHHLWSKKVNILLLTKINSLINKKLLHVFIKLSLWPNHG